MRSSLHETPLPQASAKRNSRVTASRRNMTLHALHTKSPHAVLPYTQHTSHKNPNPVDCQSNAGQLESNAAQLQLRDY